MIEWMRENLSFVLETENKPRLRGDERLVEKYNKKISFRLALRRNRRREESSGKRELLREKKGEESKNIETK